MELLNFEAWSDINIASQPSVKMVGLVVDDRLNCDVWFINLLLHEYTLC